MARFDLIGEYTCAFVPRSTRNGARAADAARWSASASGLFVGARGRSTLAATIGFVILIIAAATLSLV